MFRRFQFGRGCRAADHFRGKPPAQEICGHKKSAFTCTRCEGGPKLTLNMLVFPSSCLWQDSRRHHTTPDLMSMKSRSSGFEVNLLASPSHPVGQWLVSAFVARYSGTLPHGIRTRFPILPWLSPRALFMFLTQLIVFDSKNFPTNSDCRLFCQDPKILNPCLALSPTGRIYKCRPSSKDLPTSSVRFSLDHSESFTLYELPAEVLHQIIPPGCLRHDLGLMQDSSWRSEFASDALNIDWLYRATSRLSIFPGWCKTQTI